MNFEDNQHDNTPATVVKADVVCTRPLPNRSKLVQEGSVRNLIQEGSVAAKRNALFGNGIGGTKGATSDKTIKDEPMVIMKHKMQPVKITEEEDDDDDDESREKYDQDPHADSHGGRYEEENASFDEGKEGPVDANPYSNWLDDGDDHDDDDEEEEVEREREEQEEQVIEEKKEKSAAKDDANNPQEEEEEVTATGEVETAKATEETKVTEVDREIKEGEAVSLQQETEQEGDGSSKIENATTGKKRIDLSSGFVGISFKGSPPMITKIAPDSAADALSEKNMIKVGQIVTYVMVPGKGEHTNFDTHFLSRLLNENKDKEGRVIIVEDPPEVPIASARKEEDEEAEEAKDKAL